jgi:biopolymer transport protein ExbB
MTPLELLLKGGTLMIPIALLSVLAAVILFERLWTLRRSRVAPEPFFRRVLGLLHSSRHDAAESACAADGSALARVFLTALKHRGLPRTELKEVMEEAGEVEVSWMGRFIEGVGTVAAVSPLVGLLGTVTGMIRVFQEVANAAEPRVSQLAGGIWEALITTGAGLTVAIPAYLAYRWLQGIVDARVRVLQEWSLEVLDALDETRANPTTPAPPSASSPPPAAGTPPPDQPPAVAP